MNAILQLRPGEAVHLRTLTGRISSVIPDIIGLDVLFSLSHLILLQHSDCGAAAPYMTPESIHTHVADHLVAEGVVNDVLQVDGEESVRTDLMALSTMKGMRKELVESATGLWWDMQTGLVRKVEI